MEQLYCPWRQAYSTLSHHREKYTHETCVFCAILNHPEDDEHNLVIKRGENWVVIMNLFPYNAGHLLAIPTTHVAQLDELSPDQLSELMFVVKDSISWLNQVCGPDGFNMGINLGEAAGAGIPEHLHWHILPRWKNDTNFMPLLANTKQISFDIQQLCSKLREIAKV